MKKELTVHIVDDDPSVRDALSVLFRAAGLAVRGYGRAEEFLAKGDELAPGCLVADVRLPGMNGLELHRAIVQADMPIPVVVMTGHGDIPMAVAALKEGAVDFLEKPFDPTSLLESVRRALALAESLREESARRVELKEKFDLLTPREQEVMRLLIDGNPTKVVAAELGISSRTAETHRARVMEKMGARTLSDLVRYGLILDRANVPR